MSLIYNFAPFLIALASRILSNDPPSWRQWVGVLLSVLGATIYFLPFESNTAITAGYLVALIGLLSCSTSSLLGRHLNQRSGLPPIVITTVSMGIGGLLLLMVGGTTQGFGQLNLTQWLIIGWLAIVNTGLAFTLWNTALRTLSALESSIINNSILIQVAVLAWLVLDETLTTQQIFAMILVVIGVIIVQVRRPIIAKHRTSSPKSE